MVHLRSALFIVFLVVVTLSVAIVGFPTLVFGERAARRAIKIWARIVLAGLAFFCGLRHRVEGHEHIPTGGALVASNHQSMWETLVFFTLLTEPVAIFKKELLRVPVYGWWGARAGNIPVDRTAGPRAIREVSRAARTRIAEGAQIVVFPEGTRSPAGRRGRLQPGVAAIYLSADAPCTPAVHDSGRFWRHPGWVKHPGVITLRFLPPIPAGLDRKTFVTALEDSLDKGLAALARRAENPPHDES